MRDDRVPLSRSLAVVNFAVAKPKLAEQPRSKSGAYFPLEQLPPISDSDRQLLGIAFGAFLDEVLGDALARRRLPRGVLHRKTDGFDGRSPLASRIGVHRAKTPAPVLKGMLPDPFPMSSLRMLYEHILGVPLDCGTLPTTVPRSHRPRPTRRAPNLLARRPTPSRPTLHLRPPRLGTLVPHRRRHRVHGCARLKTASGGRAHRLAVSKGPAAR